MKPRWEWPIRAVALGLGMLVVAVATQAQPVVSSTLLSWGDNTFGQTVTPPWLTNVVAVSAGYDHNIALQADGQVVVWAGDPRLFPVLTNIPPAASRAMAISAGTYFCVALTTNGTVVCWGDNTWGQLNMPAGLSNVVEIGAGDSHALAVKSDGTVVAWGENTAGQTNVPLGLANVVAVAGGGRHSLALRADGTVVAWGANTNAYGLPAGQATVPTGLANVVAISAGDYHSLALRRDGTVVAWGDNTFQQSILPAGLTNVVAIEEGRFHCLAIRGDGTGIGWGYGLLGVTTVPPNVMFAELSAGGAHNLAVTGSFAPVILAQPGNQTASPGSRVDFRVKAAGTQRLRYQWRLNGSILSGATNAVLTLYNVQFADMGNYSVVVQNASGSVVSANATLTVSGAVPFISVQPFSQTIFAGGTAIFSVTAGGSTPLSYQWRLAGTNLPGATGASLVVRNATTSQAGAYSVVVSNPLGTATSANALLTVLPLTSGGQVVAWGLNTWGVTNVPPGLTNVVGVAAGGTHNVVLRGDGTVVSWGRNNTNLYVPPTATSVVAVAAGMDHGLALRSDSTVVDWGIYPVGAGTMPSGLSNVVAVAAGGNGSHSLALKADGTVVAWGDGQVGQTNVPAGLMDVVGVAAGSTHSLAVKRDGTVVAWGRDDSGQCTIPGGLSNVVAVSAGGAFSLALRNNGTVVAWGRNDVSASQTNVPAGLSGVTAISAGGSHSLAVKGDTTVVGWGDHWFGQLPVPNGLNNAVTVSSGWQHSLALVVSLYPCISLQPISQFVIAGSTATFTVAAGGLSPLSYQWRLGGADIQGATNATFTLTNVQSGNAGVYSVAVSNIYGTVTSANATLTVATPPVLLTQPASQTVSAGADVTFQVTASGSTPLDYQWRFGGVPIAGATNASLALLGVRTNQTGAFSVVVTNVVGSATSTNAVLTVLPVLGPQWVVAWGENTWGQTNVPPGLSNVIMAAGANEHSVALKSDGTIVAWGGNTLGQTHVPADLTNAVAIAAGGHYSLALKTDGTVAGWGLNNVGQLDIPSGLTNVTAIAAGEAHGVALKGDGTLAVWGYNTYGATNMPAGLSNVVAVTAGSMHSLALKGDSTVVAWGDNRFGQCDMPGGLSNVVAAAGGAMHSLALKADSTVVAWGTDYFGETHVPAGLTNVVAIAAGNTRSLALKRDGSVVTWGATAMGDGTTSASLTNAVAIAAGSLHSLAILGTVPPTQTPPLLQTQFVSSSASFSVSVPTVPGLTYYLEFKTALSDPTWTPLMVVFGDGTTQTLSDSTAGSPQRFYRIRIQ